MLEVEVQQKGCLTAEYPSRRHLPAVLWCRAAASRVEQFQTHHWWSLFPSETVLWTVTNPTGIWAEAFAQKSRDRSLQALAIWTCCIKTFFYEVFLFWRKPSLDYDRQGKGKPVTSHMLSVSELPQLCNIARLLKFLDIQGKIQVRCSQDLQFCEKETVTGTWAYISKE